jgi:hypothetical protein
VYGMESDGKHHHGLSGTTRKFLLFLAVLAVAAPLAGCGSGRATTVTVTTPPVSTQPAAANTHAVAPLSSTPQATPPSGPPDFVLTGQTADGDKVRVEGRFGPALPPARTDANQTALGECGEADGRELIARLDLTTTIQSNLAGSVAIRGFHTLSNPKGLTEFLMGYSEGATCHPGDLPASEVELGSLQPHVPHPFTLWVILGKAITPNDPHPSAKELGQGWGMDIPIISVNNTPATRGIAAGGPRVLTCKPRASEIVAGTVASGSFISITGTPAYTITVQEPASEYRMSCARVPTP